MLNLNKLRGGGPGDVGVDGGRSREPAQPAEGPATLRHLLQRTLISLEPASFF